MPANDRRFTVKTASMLPIIAAGDQVRVTPLTPQEQRDPKKLLGKVVAYRRGGEVVVHRLLATYGNWFCGQGEKILAHDPPVLLPDLIGTVPEIASRRWRTAVKRWRAHLSSAPFELSWRHKAAKIYNFAGMPLIMMVPKELTRLAIWRGYTAWQNQSDFQTWLVDIEVQRRTFAKVDPQNPTYQLQVKVNRQGGTITAQHFAAQFDWASKRSRLQLSQHDTAGSLENFLRAMLGVYLLRHSGFLLHASCVVRGPAAYVFFGASGAGKSTLAALARGAGYQVISDDLVAIRYWRGQWVVDGLPFKGSHAAAVCSAGVVPLRGVYRLAHGSRHAVTPMSSAAACAAVTSAVPFLQHDPIGVEQVLSTLAQMSTTLPVRQLHFKPDNGFWQLLLDH